ncbi:Vacuolar protein sorting/targeting protein PEP1 [Thelohanellus kitauei]|uniref:Vacuolar protein sorting/targeting protein PEP1 n=1 Tax=Thelohanellus kitauei TaxID=669202 RepID=A0A0C2IU99_THEKT|nr:Vacuolar protein sorting/targeting protein PEP1 [Thelohanellus kitauei]
MWNLVIWDGKTKDFIDVKCPNFRIKDIIQFNYLHEQYYIIILTNQEKKCLLSNYDGGDFVIITCDLDTSSSQSDCPVAVNPHIHGVIYANIKKTSQQAITYISTDDGITFEPIKLINFKGQDVGGLKLTIPCSIINSMNFPMPWISVFDGVYNLSRDHQIISIDGGLNWRLTPLYNFRPTVLNDGGIIFGVDPHTEAFVFSYDSDSWYNVKIHPDDDIMIVVPNGHPSTKFVNVISKNTVPGMLKLTNLDFLTVLNRTCQDDDFESWSMPRPHSYCCDRQNISYLRIKNNSFCAADRAKIIEQA